MAEGDALIEQGFFEEAERVFEAASVYYPDSPEPAERLGRISFLLRDLSEMIRRGRMMLDKFPENIWGYTRVGDGFRDLGDLDEAREVYLSMLDKFPNEMRAYGRLQHLAWLRENYEESYNWAMKLIDLFPEKPIGYMKAHDSLVMQGCFSDSEQLLQKMKEQLPGMVIKKHASFANLVKSGGSTGHLIYSFTTLNVEFWAYLCATFRFFGAFDLKNTLIHRRKGIGDKTYELFLDTLGELLSRLGDGELNTESDEILLDTINALSKECTPLCYIGMLTQFLSEHGRQKYAKSIVGIVTKEYLTHDFLENTKENSTWGCIPVEISDKLEKIFLHFFASAFWEFDSYSVYTHGITLMERYCRMLHRGACKKNEALPTILDPKAIGFVEKIFTASMESDLDNILKSKNKNAALTVVFSSVEYKELFDIWYANYSRKVEENLVVVALDNRIYAHVQKKYPQLSVLKVNIFHENNYTFGIVLWKVRLYFAKFLLNSGFSIYISGVDTYLFRDPEAIFNKIDSDLISVGGYVDRLSVCGDMLYMRCTHGMKQFLGEVLKFYRASLTDEGAINVFLKYKNSHICEIEKRRDEYSSYFMPCFNFKMSLLKYPLTVHEHNSVSDSLCAQKNIFYFCPGSKPYKLYLLKTGVEGL